MNISFELPGQCKYRMHFINKYKTSDIRTNIQALSHCYANYKILGVKYCDEIMEIIYQFDKDFCIDNQVVKLITENRGENDIQTSFYQPENFSSAQDKVGFKFINFVKSLSNMDESTKSLPIVEEVIEPKCNGNDEENLMIMFNDALKDSSFKNDLKTFQDEYIKILVESSLTDKKILHHLCNKMCIPLTFKNERCDDAGKASCTIIIKEIIVIGRGYGKNSKEANDEALIDLQKNIAKDIFKSTNDSMFKAFSDDDSEDLLEDAEFFELPSLQDFYIKNNRNDFAATVLQEAFQFFKMCMHFEEAHNKLHLFINDHILASMPLHGTLTNSKMLLSKFVLKNLEKSKWTLIRHTYYINQFENSVDKEVMYEKNSIDHTKIDSTNNIGGKLMLKMGWNEDLGLGKSGAGMKDPIINESSGRRQGFGFNFGSSKDLKSFTNNISKYLRNWINEDGDDIIFDRDFDNKERAMVHRECRKLGLTSKSYNNTNGDRYLVVSKFRSPHELFDWVQSKGGKTRLYTLIPPACNNI